MTWKEICEKYPKSYVLLKDFHESRSEDLVTIIDATVVTSSSDPKKVYQEYRARKDQEKVIFGYTGWEKFEIEERPFLGLRPAPC